MYLSFVKKLSLKTIDSTIMPSSIINLAKPGPFSKIFVTDFFVQLKGCAFLLEN